MAGGDTVEQAVAQVPSCRWGAGGTCCARCALEKRVRAQCLAAGSAEHLFASSEALQVDYEIILEIMRLSAGLK